MVENRRVEKRFSYNENPTLLWLLAVSVVSASAGIVGAVIDDRVFSLGLFALSIILLCVVFAVFVVAIVAPIVSELLLNSHYGKKFHDDGKEDEGELFGHNVIVRDGKTFDE
jgi:hypothetical protein